MKNQPDRIGYLPSVPRGDAMFWNIMTLAALLVARRSDFVSMGGFSFARRSISI